MKFIKLLFFWDCVFHFFFLNLQMREGYHDMAKPIVNEMDKDFFVDTLHSTEQQLPKPAGKSVEIPPPCDMDYYADTSAASKRSNWQGMRTRYMGVILILGQKKYDVLFE